MGTGCNAYSAVVPFVKLKIVFLFPLITGLDIQKFFTGYSRMPCIALQRLCRAGLYAEGTAAAKVLLYGCCAGEFKISKNRSQADPWSELACDKLAMTADPPQSGPSGGCLVRKIAFYIDHIGAM